MAGKMDDTEYSLRARKNYIGHHSNLLYTVYPIAD